MRLSLLVPAGLLLAVALAPPAAACTVDMGPHVDQDLGPVGVAVHHSTCPGGARYVEFRVLDHALRIPL